MRLRRFTGIGACRICAGLVVAAVLTADVGAQEGYPPAFLPADHWSVRAAYQLSALGLAPRGHDPARRVLTQRELGRLFEAAAAAAVPGSYAASLATHFLHLFRSEFGVSPEPRAGATLVGTQAGAGYKEATGRVRTGFGYEDGHPYGDWNDPAAIGNEYGPELEGVLQATALNRIAIRIAGTGDDERQEVTEATIALDVAAVALWAGRRPLAWGQGAGRGIVLGGHSFDGAGVQTTRPVALPWHFRRLGPIHLEGFLAQEDFEHSCQDPNLGSDAPPCSNAWFLATRGTISPHARLSLGVSRAAFLGGEGNSSIDAFAIFSVLIGKHAGEASELDNQLVALDASYRPPTESWIPLRLYLEWGFEDSAGAWFNVPGILAGVEAPAVPGWPALGVALERVSFAKSCCDNPIWYRHSVFHDGWTSDGEPLGHPLGGHGSEWAVRATHVNADAAVRARLSLYRRYRGGENLYADRRAGISHGGEAGLEVRLMAPLELVVSGGLQDGEGWRERFLRLGLRTFL